jgi:hypothetical protein
MSEKIQKTRLRKGVAVGSAVILGASLGDSTGRRADFQSVDVNTIRDASPGQSVNTEEVMAAARPMIAVSLPPAPTNWTKADARRFRELATKRATDVVSTSEQDEFMALQNRRRLHYVSSAEELISEWQRRRFASEILNVLSRNVRFFKAEDQARLRSLRQA